MKVVEGILINKFPYKDKHFIGHLLLRNGMKVSVIFYGAQGGGKKHKSSILQIGYLFRIDLTINKKTSFEMLNSKEFSEKWFHQNISSNPKAFYLLCFFCEFVDKFSASAHEEHDLDESYNLHEGVFRLLSNAIFHLDKSIGEDKYDHELQLFVFLTKALVEFGIFPRTESCAISGTKIDDNDAIALKADSGSFAKLQTMSMEEQRIHNGSVGQVIRKSIIEVAEKKYGEVQKISGVNLDCSKELLEYICFQQNLKLKDFKTISMIL